MSTPGVGYPPGYHYTPYYNSSAMNNTKFNPTMAVIIIVLIGGCFVLGFVSVFVRKCMTNETAMTTTSTDRLRSSSSKTRGLDKAAVDALPIVHSTDLDERHDIECPVCLAEFEPEDSLRLLPVCKHVFHKECIDAWFDAHSTCPLCRASVTGQVGIVRNGSGLEHERRETVQTVAEASENGDSDVELQPVRDAASLDDSQTNTVTGVPPPSAMISREDERNSARGTLSRNSQSFKRAARGTTALEKAASLGAQHNKPPTAPGSRKFPLTPSTTTGIHRASSLGTDLIALRNLLTGVDQNSSGNSYNLNRAHSGVPKSDVPPSTSWFTRARSVDLGARVQNLLNGNPSSFAGTRENWSTIDLESGKSSTAGAITSKGEASTSAALERAWSDRWSLASLRSAMFPLSRSTSDVSSRANSHLQV